ncbi:MAG: chemotaxis protein CheW [Desulfuromonas sp.]|nr:MAG: chemotaxis protein CheW [Desulfuromonas sp.]
MDLVEIRKKAKVRQQDKRDSEKPVSEPVADQVDQPPVDEPPVAEPPPIEPDEEPMQEDAVAGEEVKVADEPFIEDPVATEPEQQEPVENDPLDALFAFTVDGGLATEANYLQALTNDDDSVDQDVQQWLTFALANEEYALTIDSVSEIIKPREVTDIPRVPDFIKGIISLRGIIVPVFDLNRRLNLDQTEVSSSSRIIVCQNNERLAGFIVDRINQVVNVPLANIEPPPTVLSGLDRDFVEGVGRVDGKMLILLHLSSVMDAELV